MKAKNFCLFLLFVAFAWKGGAFAKERVFFAFDDHSIPWHHNLKLTLVQAEKHPDNPVLRRGPEGAPDHGHCILYGTVLKDGDRFRMWYLGMFETDLKAGQAPGWWRPMCYAESKDGVHWTKPDLGLVEFNGNRKNNICLIEGDPESMTKINDFLSILHEPDDPDPEKRYKAAYIAHMPYDDIKGGMSSIGTKERRVGASIYATSADGLSWKVVGDRPANAGGERFEVSSLYRFGNFYYSTGQLAAPWSWYPDGSDSGRIMLVYRSPDFKTWSKAKAFGFARPGQLINPPVKGQQTHMGAGMWNRGNVVVGLYGMWEDAKTKPEDGKYWNKGVSVDLGLIVSNDGIHFREPVPDFKIIPRGNPGDWDDIALLQGHAFFNDGERTLIWYSHWDTGGKLKSMEIGLATMRRDGFGYLSRQVAESDAHFVTSTFESAEKDALFINVDGITDEAPITVELLDEFDRPVPGFSGKDAAIISMNSTIMPVIWPGKDSIHLPADKPLAIRVNLPSNSEAKVFALYVQ